MDGDVGQPITQGDAMTFRDLRLGWRALTQEPAYLAVAVSGLGIGLAAAALLLGLVRYSTQYNAHVPDAEHVYVVKQRFNVDPKAPVFDQAPLFLRAVAGRLPGVIGATGYVPTRPLNRPLTLRGENHGALRRLDGLTVLPGFTATLGVRALAGNLDAALAQPDSFAITRQAALRLFGSADAVGRTLRAEGQLLRVAAVVATPPSNTTIPFEALFGATSLLGEPELRHELLTGDQGWWGKLLIRVRPDASVADITHALQRTLDDSAVSGKLKPEARQRLGQRHAMELSLAPLRDAYFDEEVAGNGISAPGERARPAVVAALAALALLIVALAAVNYVNLSTLRVLRRQRDIAMRMVLGAGARRIATQLLIEALLVALLATALALLLAWLALPAFCRLVQRDLGGLFTPGYVAAALAGGVMLGMLTALHPTALALRVRPALALAGRRGGEGPGRRGAGGGVAKRVRDARLARLRRGAAAGGRPAAAGARQRGGARLHRRAGGAARRGRRGRVGGRRRAAQRGLVSRAETAGRRRRDDGNQIGQREFFCLVRHPAADRATVRCAHRPRRRCAAGGAECPRGARARLRHAAGGARCDAAVRRRRRQARRQAHRRHRAGVALPDAA